MPPLLLYYNPLCLVLENVTIALGIFQLSTAWLPPGCCRQAIHGPVQPNGWWLLRGEGWEERFGAGRVRTLLYRHLSWQSSVSPHP